MGNLAKPDISRVLNIFLMGVTKIKLSHFCDTIYSACHTFVTQYIEIVTKVFHPYYCVYFFVSSYFCFNNFTFSSLCFICSL
ncbi:hypothetical protein EUA52_11720 [Staphylococcus saprophyticus]|nr:hypothetical protein EUA52_11720 [Staphylococcus saprophyticus]